MSPVGLGRVKRIRRALEVPPENANESRNPTGGSRDQIVMRRMEGEADRGAAVGNIPVPGEMESIRRLSGRVRSTIFRGRSVP